MLVSAVLRKLDKLEKKQINGFNLKMFFYTPTDAELSVLDKNTDVYVFLDDELEE